MLFSFLLENIKGNIEVFNKGAILRANRRMPLKYFTLTIGMEKCENEKKRNSILNLNKKFQFEYRL